MRPGRLHHRATLAVALTLATGAVAAALTPERPFDQYAFRAWSVEQGLPHQSIEAIAQTSDGYLWVGTESGLVRFDGAAFTVFDRTNTAAIRNNTVYALLAESDG